MTSPTRSPQPHTEEAGAPSELPNVSVERQPSHRIAEEENTKYTPESSSAHIEQAEGSRSRDVNSAESQESGEASESTPETKDNDDTSGAPPLPNEPPPAQEDDGWEFQWDSTHQAYYFYNRFTNETTWENPRISNPTSASASASAATGIASPPRTERPPAGGYNPAIHGDYDPNAWYAQKNNEAETQQEQAVDPAEAYAAIGQFNRFTGRWQSDDQNPDRHDDEHKSRRQMNAYFDVDAAANSHDGRSLKAERSGKKPTKSELKHFKEKRRAKKEEKRRAWLRD